MKNVKLEKSIKGWFLTIGDDVVKNKWAVTSLELWCLGKIIRDNMDEIMNEIKECDAGCQIFTDGIQHRDDCPFNETRRTK